MLVICPKCELNYMESTDRMCRVCYREIHGTDVPEETELCSVCNETPVMSGKDLCPICYKEISAERALADDEDAVAEDGEDDEEVIDEIVPDLVDSDDIPEPEFQEIDRNLSLDELSEQEEADSDEEEEDD